MARTVVQLHGLYPDYITYSVIYMGYGKILRCVEIEQSRFYHMLKMHKFELYFLRTWRFYLMCVWFYDMKLPLPVFIVFIVHIAIYIVGD